MPPGHLLSTKRHRSRTEHGGPPTGFIAWAGPFRGAAAPLRAGITFASKWASDNLLYPLEEDERA